MANKKRDGIKLKIRLSISVAILAVLSLFTYLSYDAARLYDSQGAAIDSQKYTLFFDSAIAAIPLAIFIGIFLGFYSYRKKKDMKTPVIIDGKVERHDQAMFVQHWTNALGVLFLIITGFALGTLFIPRMISGVEDIGFALNLHFVGILFFLFGVTFYITEGILSGELKKRWPKSGDFKRMTGRYLAMFTGGTYPKEEKVLSAERFTFPLWAFGLIGITLSGIVKVLFFIWPLPNELMSAMMIVHGVFAIYITLLLIAHIVAAAIVPPSWPLLRSMFTGKVSEQYVKEYHEKWYEEIK